MDVITFLIKEKIAFVSVLLPLKDDTFPISELLKNLLYIINHIVLVSKNLLYIINHIVLVSLMLMYYLTLKLISWS